MFIGWKMNKQIMGYPYNEIIFYNKMNDVMIHVTTWMTLEHILSEKNSHKITYIV